MKRSTIILIIFLVLLIITPIVIVKTVNNLSPESKLKGIQTLWNKSDPNTPTRYIITEEYFGSDSIGTTINITTDADSKSTLIDNHRYDEDTIRISGNAHSSYNIIYEEEVNLIIENKNPNIKFKIANANLSKISLNSSGETDIVSSNLGTLIFQDSINTAPIRLLQNNIGGLIALSCTNRPMEITENNIGTAIFPEKYRDFSLVNNNIGVNTWSDEYNITIGSETNNDSAETHGTFKMKINVKTDE